MVDGARRVYWRERYCDTALFVVSVCLFPVSIVTNKNSKSTHTCDRQSTQTANQPREVLYGDMFATCFCYCSTVVG